MRRFYVGKEPALSEKLSRLLRVQEDVLARAPVITGYGSHRLCIENYRSVLEYRETLIRIQTRTGKIVIQGEKLVIAYYRDDVMCVVGKITGILFTNQEE